MLLECWPADHPGRWNENFIDTKSNDNGGLDATLK